MNFETQMPELTDPNGYTFWWSTCFGLVCFSLAPFVHMEYIKFGGPCKMCMRGPCERAPAIALAVVGAGLMFLAVFNTLVRVFVFGYVDVSDWNGM